MARKLSKKFISDLKSGLSPIGTLLSFVKADDTLDMEIRENSLNIYYRGGSILKINEKKGEYELIFDFDYLSKEDKESRSILNGYFNERKWFSFFPLAKQAMDFYF